MGLCRSCPARTAYCEAATQHARALQGQTLGAQWLARGCWRAALPDASCKAAQGALGGVDALLAQQARGCHGVGCRAGLLRLGAQGLAERVHLVQVALHHGKALGALRQAV